MILDMHPSVKLVAEFMQRSIPADELRGVAKAVALVAPSIWSAYPDQEVRPLGLAEPPITQDGLLE